MCVGLRVDAASCALGQVPGSGAVGQVVTPLDLLRGCLEPLVLHLQGMQLQDRHMLGVLLSPECSHQTWWPPPGDAGPAPGCFHLAGSVSKLDTQCAGSHWDSVVPPTCSGSDPPIPLGLDFQGLGLLPPSLLPPGSMTPTSWPVPCFLPSPCQQRLPSLAFHRAPRCPRCTRAMPASCLRAFAQQCPSPASGVPSLTSFRPSLQDPPTPTASSSPALSPYPLSCHPERGSAVACTGRHCRAALFSFTALTE